ncbi:hypothetical protein BY996DRAFT_6499871 [Phakopsora pachyrhizi]|nr:hypothetical protein BY996DRAFT_6499871 [Phakopsora pachyrhizi]
MINGLVDSIHQLQNKAAAVIEDIHAGSWEGHEVCTQAVEDIRGKVVEAIHSQGKLGPKWLQQAGYRHNSSYLTSCLLGFRRGRDGVVEPGRPTEGVLAKPGDSRSSETERGFLNDMDTGKCWGKAAFKRPCKKPWPGRSQPKGSIWRAQGMFHSKRYRQEIARKWGNEFEKKEANLNRRSYRGREPKQVISNWRRVIRNLAARTTAQVSAKAKTQAQQRRSNPHIRK